MSNRGKPAEILALAALICETTAEKLLAMLPPKKMTLMLLRRDCVETTRNVSARG
jgi:hypothetical protein